MWTGLVVTLTDSLNAKMQDVLTCQITYRLTVAVMS